MSRALPIAWPDDLLEFEPEPDEPFIEFRTAELVAAADVSRHTLWREIKNTAFDGGHGKLRISASQAIECCARFLDRDCETADEAFALLRERLKERREHPERFIKRRTKADTPDDEVPSGAPWADWVFADRTAEILAAADAWGTAPNSVNSFPPPEKQLGLIKPAGEGSAVIVDELCALLFGENRRRARRAPMVRDVLRHHGMDLAPGQSAPMSWFATSAGQACWAELIELRQPKAKNKARLSADLLQPVPTTLEAGDEESIRDLWDSDSPAFLKPSNE